ncbi:MAG: AIR synthase-related protein [Candidatus Hodarchaeales archaeon]|jgi:phosphoribosylformylglycinamidine cyclo-ligase
MSVKDSERYSALGVSSTKAGVLRAAQSQDKGLFPNAFCKIVPDLLAYNKRSCVALHADGVGTKAIVAYLMYKETNDPFVFASLAQDALAMNIDDLLCIGSTGPFILSNTIGRNRGLISDQIVEAILTGYSYYSQKLIPYGIDVTLCGGETADIGDLVRTLVVDASVVCRLGRTQVIDNTRIKEGNVIIGLSSSGQSTYESEENSGIGSNGLTLARHALLSARYKQYSEVIDPALSSDLAYVGSFELTSYATLLGMTVGQALLSPTRTYAPIIDRLSREIFCGINGIIHCTGGGQTKCLRANSPVNFVKNDVFYIPPIFHFIRDAGRLTWKEMYQVFNMGHRMELFVEPIDAQNIINIVESFGVKAKVIGECVSPSKGPRLTIKGPEGELYF